MITSTRLLLAGALLVATSAAEAGPRRTVSCQRNTEDGRILVDGRQVGERTYRVVSYRVTRNEGLWTYGRCVIDFN